MVTSTTDSSVHIDWEQLISVPSLAAAYYGYQVEYKKIDMDEFELSSHHFHKNSTTMNAAVMTDLDYNTEYVIRVHPYRQWPGESPEFGTPYPEIMAETKCSGW